MDISLTEKAVLSIHLGLLFAGNPVERWKAHHVFLPTEHCMVGLFRGAGHPSAPIAVAFMKRIRDECDI